MNHQKTIDGMKQFIEQNDLKGGVFLILDKSGAYQHLTMNLSAFETIGCLTYLADQRDVFLQNHKAKEVTLDQRPKPALTPVN